jgi:hypothetical protein
MKIDTQRGDETHEEEQVLTLAEADDEKVVLKQKSRVKKDGQDSPRPDRNQEYRAKAPLEGVTIDKQGEEEIEVAGKKLKCHWFEFTQIARGKTTKGKCWMSGEIPGGTAKVEATQADNGPTLKIEVLDWERK